MKKKLLSIASPKAKMLKKCVALLTSLLMFFSIGVGLEAYAAETAAIPSGSVFIITWIML